MLKAIFCSSSRQEYDYMRTVDINNILKKRKSPPNRNPYYFHLIFPNYSITNRTKRLMSVLVTLRPMDPLTDHGPDVCV